MHLISGIPIITLVYIGALVGTKKDSEVPNKGCRFFSEQNFLKILLEVFVETPGIFPTSLLPVQLRLGKRDYTHVTGVDGGCGRT